MCLLSSPLILSIVSYFVLFLTLSIWVYVFKILFGKQKLHRELRGVLAVAFSVRHYN